MLIGGIVYGVYWVHYYVLGLKGHCYWAVVVQLWLGRWSKSSNWKFDVQLIQSLCGSVFE